MSVFDKLQTARENRDIAAYADLMTEDCVFVRHQSGTEMHKPEIVEMLTKMMESGGDFGETRLIYENDDILVVHSLNDYPDGSREAVLAAYTLRGGKMSRLETGATPLAK